MADCIQFSNSDDPEDVEAREFIKDVRRQLRLYGPPYEELERMAVGLMPHLEAAETQEEKLSILFGAILRTAMTSIQYQRRGIRDS